MAQGQDAPGAAVGIAPDAPSPEAPSPESCYVLQRGDEISIRVFNLPELGETVRIRPDGRVSAMLLDDVEAAGMTATALDALLTERYREYYRDPQVTVIVRTFANERVYVAGEVARPGPIDLRGKLTALGAVVEAGGFTGTARTDSVILLRNGGEGRPLVTRLNLKETLNRGEPDVALQAFDVVYVPMSRIAKVDKFVDQYIRQLIPVSLNLGFTYLLGESAVVVP